MSDIEILELPISEGMKRSGWTEYASFDNVVEELKVRRGRLLAKSGGIWHIVPNPPKPLSKSNPNSLERNDK